MHYAAYENTLGAAGVFRGLPVGAHKNFIDSGAMCGSAGDCHRDLD